MGKHIVDKAKDIAIDITKGTKHNINRGKLKVRKSWENFKDFVLSQNKKADKKAKESGRGRQNLTGGTVITERAKNGGII